MAYSAIILLPVPAVTLFLLSALGLYIMIHCFVNYRKLSQFKGPPLAAVSGLWLWRQSLAKRMHIAEAEVLRKYGTSTKPCILNSSATDVALMQVHLHELDPVCL
jgi:hypothetical protein